MKQNASCARIAVTNHGAVDSEKIGNKKRNLQASFYRENQLLLCMNLTAEESNIR
jgi:hypothetical protein